MFGSAASAADDITGDLGRRGFIRRERPRAQPRSPASRPRAARPREQSAKPARSVATGASLRLRFQQTRKLRGELRPAVRGGPARRDLGFHRHGDRSTGQKISSRRRGGGLGRGGGAAGSCVCTGAAGVGWLNREDEGAVDGSGSSLDGFGRACDPLAAAEESSSPASNGVLADPSPPDRTSPWRAVPRSLREFSLLRALLGRGEKRLIVTIRGPHTGLRAGARLEHDADRAQRREHRDGPPARDGPAAAGPRLHPERWRPAWPGAVARMHRPRARRRVGGSGESKKKFETHVPPAPIEPASASCRRNESTRAIRFDVDRPRVASAGQSARVVHRLPGPPGTSR